MKSETDLIDGLEILRYEEEMLRETFKELALAHPVNASEFMDSSGVTVEYSHPYFKSYSKYIHDAILESFLIHVRIFIEFLYRRGSNHPTDIFAQDYFESPNKWHKIVGEIPRNFKNTKDDIDKWLAHLSLKRKRSDKEWNPPKLHGWVTSGLKLFHDNRY